MPEKNMHEKYKKAERSGRDPGALFNALESVLKAGAGNAASSAGPGEMCYNKP